MLFILVSKLTFLRKKLQIGLNPDPFPSLQDATARAQGLFASPTPRKRVKNDPFWVVIEGIEAPLEWSVVALTQPQGFRNESQLTPVGSGSLLTGSALSLVGSGSCPVGYGLTSFVPGRHTIGSVFNSVGSASSPVGL